jgi:hypothetical protein
MKLDWRQGILYATTIGVEGCWLYAIFALLNKQVADSHLSVMGIMVLYPVAFIFNALLGQLRWPRAYILSMSWLGWVVGMLLIIKVQLFGDLPLSQTAWLLSIPRSIAEVIYTFRPELLLLVSTGVLWWLGQRLARRVVNFPSMLGEFQFGLVMLVLTFSVTSLLGAQFDHPVPVALSFFFFGLLGISVAHALGGNSWLSGLYQGRWSGLLLVSISLILILGLLISLVVTPHLLQLFWEAIKRVGEVIWGLIVKVMDFLVSLFPAREPPELPSVPTVPTTAPAEEFKPFTMPEWLQSGLRIGWIVLVAGTLLFVLWRVPLNIFRWLRRRLASMAGAEFEPLPGAFQADFLGLLKRILFRLLGLKLPFRLRGRGATLPPEVASVRQIYRQFLRWAAAGGYPRYISQTPYEYCYTLTGLLPGAREDLNLVTQQYVSVRYGALPPSGDELDKLSQAWHRVRRTRLKRPTTELAHDKEVT